MYAIHDKNHQKLRFSSLDRILRRKPDKRDVRIRRAAYNSQMRFFLKLKETRSILNWKHFSFRHSTIYFDTR